MKKNTRNRKRDSNS